MSEFLNIALELCHEICGEDIGPKILILAEANSVGQLTVMRQLSDK